MYSQHGAVVDCAARTHQPPVIFKLEKHFLLQSVCLPLTLLVCPCPAALATRQIYDVLFIHSAGKQTHTLTSCWGTHSTPGENMLLLIQLISAIFPFLLFCQMPLRCILLEFSDVVLPTEKHRDYLLPCIEIWNVFSVVRAIRQSAWLGLWGFSLFDFSSVWTRRCQVSSVHN